MAEVRFFIQTDTKRMMYEVEADTGNYTAVASGAQINVYNAGINITAGQWVYLHGDDDVRVANPANLDAMTNLLGIARKTVLAGEPVPVQESGIYPFAALPGWQAKDDLYLFGDGQMTNDPNAILQGEFIQRVALVVSTVKGLIRIGLGEPVELQEV